ncbi:MAG: HAD family hydrolase [Planctomycetes bacterium]|nr:HAD family hydrolase [Planctomycetota bacterium]MCW8134297.1 HAD family hydrolase [Planctomycetota bacterium]
MSYPWHHEQPEAVVFDMDGTLLNSGDFGVVAITRAFESMIAQGRLPGVDAPPPPQAIREQIGKPPAVFYRELLPDTFQHVHAELHHQTTLHEREFLTTGVGNLFEGTLEVLQALKASGLRLALVSNCSRPYMDCVVEVFGLDRWLEHRDCVGDKSIPGRNKSALVGQALQAMGARRGLMVGDRVHDAEAAQANGLWFVACTYGYGRDEEFASAHARINDIRHLPGLLRQA